MEPVILHTDRLVLDPPTPADRALVIEYCRDPVFERFMTLPWPYQPSDADFFLETFVPRGWRSGRELTWALRHDGRFMGTVGWRADRSNLGYWLGAPHRGHRYMAEAVTTVCGWLFSSGITDVVNWECLLGNAASEAVARAAGFTVTGEAPANVLSRDGSRPMALHGFLPAAAFAEDRGSLP